MSSSPERTALRRRGEKPGYIEVLQQRAGSLNIKRLLLIKENQLSQVKEFSALLYMGRCKRLNSLKSFIHIRLSYLGFPGGSDSKHLLAMRETQVWSLGWEDPLEKETATHSSTLAWKIPWTEEPGRIQSMGLLSQTRLSDFTFTFKLSGASVLCFSHPEVPWGSP